MTSRSPRLARRRTPVTVARRLLLVAALSGVPLALGATASPAASPNVPFIGNFTFTQPISDTFSDAPCADGLTGTLTGTETVSAHYTNNPTFFHIEGTNTQTYRIDFSDGSYALGSYLEHFAEAANSGSGTLKLNDTSVERDVATVYAADGTPIGTVTIWVTSHTTFIDANQNGQVDEGELKASISNFRFRCR
jgi:hypothetical protein